MADVTGLYNAPASERTTGSEGRDAIKLPDLSGFTNFFKARGKANQDALQDSASNEATTSYTEIQQAIRFGDVGRAAQIAVGSKAGGEDLTPDEQASIGEYESYLAKAKADIDKGKPEAVVGLLLERNKLRLLRKYPQLKPDFAKLENPEAIDRSFALEFEEEKKQRDRVNRDLEAQDDLLRSKGLTPYQLSPEERTRSVGVLRQQVAEIQSVSDLKALLEAQDGLDDVQRKVQIRKRADEVAPSIYSLALLEVTRALEGADNPDLAKAQGNAAISSVVEELRNRLSPTGNPLTTNEVRSQYDWLIKDLEGVVNGAITGEGAVKQLENSVRLRQLSAEVALTDKIPGAAMVAALNKYAGVAGGYVLKESPSFQTTIAKMLAFTASVNGVDTSRDKALNAELFGASTPTSQVLRESATHNNNLRQLLNSNIDDEDVKQAAAAIAYKQLISNRVADDRGEVIRRTTIETMADPKFVGVATAYPAPEQVKQSLLAYKEKVAAQFDSTATTLGDVELKWENNAVVISSAKGGTTTAKLQRDLNNIIRAAAHAEGSTEYQKYAQELFSGE